MGIFKDMKIYDSDGNTGIIKNVSGDNIDIVFEKIIKVTFNNLKDTELQKNHQSVRLKTDDIGTKIFFNIEDSLLTYDEIIKKEKYQTYIGSILRNSEKKQKTLMEEKQKRAPDLLKRLKHEYLSKQKSMKSEKTYFKQISTWGILHQRNLDSPYFARMDFNMAYDDVSYYVSVNQKVYHRDSQKIDHPEAV
jgi:hypothetical protein